MVRLIRKTTRLMTYPIHAGRKTIAMNVRLWNTLFWDAWYPLPMDKKLAWIAFVGQTMCVLTLFELFLLKR